MKKYIQFASILGLGLLVVAPMAFAQVPLKLATVSALKVQTPVVQAQATQTQNVQTQSQNQNQTSTHNVTAWGIITAISGNMITFQTAASGNSPKTFQVDAGSAKIYIDKTLTNVGALSIGMQGTAKGTATGTSQNSVITATTVKVHPIEAYGTVTAVNGNTITFQNGNGKTWQVNDASATIYVDGRLSSSSAIMTGVKGLAQGGWSSSAETLLNATIVKVGRGVASVSSDASLSGLAVSTGTLNPAFASSTFSYTDQVVNGVASITVTPTASQGASSTITVNGDTVPSGSASGAITLNVGSSTPITIMVTAPDGVTQDTYMITVNENPLSGDASLSGLTIANGVLTPAFAPTTTSYTDSVDNSVTSTTVTPTATQASSTITVNGTAVASGAPSTPITLNVGTTTITVVVTAPDGVTQDTYSVVVTRAPLSADASLSGLTVSTGTLNPAFASSTMSYTDAVADGVTSMTVTPTATQASSTIMVNGAVVPSGSASGAITLNVGSSTPITIMVTAPDGVTTSTYSISANE